MNVKPRLFRKDINCVNCGECISACKKELGKDGGVFSFAQSRHCIFPGRETNIKPDEVLLNPEKSLKGECYEKTCN
jgi:ferredoxin